ncbi:MAG: selenide, water dikinase SelD [Acidobacteria bacterium]|nr:selenide, water dikinase SelD [Acidobacteriota bacterium]
MVQVAAGLRGERGTDPSAATGEVVRLTRYTHGLGCACKLEPRVLEEILKELPRSSRREVLVGAETSDDACAWRLEDGTVLVQTLDFFTPVVDSPRQFGAIAAANALSDVYAMGAQPLFALNIVGFPIAVLGQEVLREILEGALEVAGEADIPVLGGHTVEDTEPKFGWVVTGTVEEADLWRNAGARPGDLLVLTKPIGTGIWATAAKHGRAPAEGWSQACVLMRQLNRDAARLLRDARPSAVTDITGFGLVGHLHELLSASRVDGELVAAAVPVIGGTRALVASGEVPGGTRANLEHARAWCRWATGLTETDRLVLCDAQTSGGLLAAVGERRADELIDELVGAGLDAAVIGRVTEAGEGHIDVSAERHSPKP